MALSLLAIGTSTEGSAAQALLLTPASSEVIATRATRTETSEAINKVAATESRTAGKRWDRQPSSARLAAQAQRVTANPTNNSFQTLHVDGETGSDQAVGTEAQPLKTVTRALEIAQPNTVIVLAPGRYSEASGEVFPLQLKPGVTIQGAPNSGEHTAIIEGGGQFTSPMRSHQNTAIIAADRAGIAQVAITNPKGYGVWVESTNPTILESVFIDNQQTGLYIASGSPRVQDSYFSGNRVAGVIVLGYSSALIHQNTFDDTGDAIRVLDGATPDIVANQITNNEAGLVIVGSARPTMRDNQISGNRRDDVVEVETSIRQPIPLPPLTSESEAEQATEQQATEQQDGENRSSIPLPVIEPTESSAIARPRITVNKPVTDVSASANNNRLAVPDNSIPIGSGNSNVIFSPPTSGTGGPPAPPSRAQSLGLYYRVFVETSDPFVQDDIRSVVPDAFRTRFEGRAMMQVGAFPTEEEAEARRRLLEENNYDALVEYIR
ncbi:DUF1565 domain-containing protein [Synechococcus sp. PCC 7335]|uniref:DUF1565 domain-containing protein n=1 Tax=Synechococcus sp. (strain ATCC 29403 / PCC 7335) TaxID=91464 RepID=UPI001D0D5E83|nr:DUF1565 domain-containing protein [Synechococcus sp. PCC 7335]